METPDPMVEPDANQTLTSPQEPTLAVDPDQEITLQLLHETVELRKLRSRITSRVALAILALLTFLFVDGYLYLKSYDTVKVIEALQKESPRVMNSLVMKNLMASVRDEIIPKYIEEFSKKLKASEPIVKQEAMDLLSGISTNIGPALQQKIVKDLNGILVETKLLLHEKHPELTEKDLMVILEAMQVEVEKQYTQRIEDQVHAMFRDINDQFSDLRKTELYTDLNRKNTADLERMFLTTSLELLIYEIDPDEGYKVKGGK